MEVNLICIWLSNSASRMHGRQPVCVQCRVRASLPPASRCSFPRGESGCGCVVGVVWLRKLRDGPGKREKGQAGSHAAR